MSIGKNNKIKDMKHDEKVLQEIIDRIDPHDKLREDELTIRIAKRYAEWAVKNLEKPAAIKLGCSKKKKTGNKCIMYVTPSNCKGCEYSEQQIS